MTERNCIITSKITAVLLSVYTSQMTE